MKKLSVLIIDDEPLARQVVRSYLKVYPDLELIGECDNGLDAVQMIQNLKPDVIFLDIQMPELSGIEVLDRLEYMPHVVFSTAHDDYAIRAFEINAVDYLLKPYNEDRFARCIDRIRNEIMNSNETTQSLMNLMQSFKQSSYPERLLVPDGDQMLFIPVDEIDYIEAADNYVSIFTSKNTFLLLQRLSDLESKLDPKQFFRIHRSYIVNVERVKSIQTWMKSAAEVVLYSDKKLPLSRRRIQDFKEQFGL